MKLNVGKFPILSSNHLIFGHAVFGIQFVDDLLAGFVTIDRID